VELISHRDDRNKLIGDHRVLVEEYNRGIENFNTNLLAVKQDNYLINIDLNEAQREFNE